MTSNKHRIPTKPKFVNAMMRLKGMSKAQQKAVLHGASNEFIRDMSSYLQKLKKRPELIKHPAHRKLLKRHRAKLRKLVHAKTSLRQKRAILTQRGGQIGGAIAAAIIAIVCASIGAAGTVGAAATSAAILKS